MRKRIVIFAMCAALSGAYVAAARESVESPLDRLVSLAPTNAHDCENARADRLAQAKADVGRWADGLVWDHELENAEQAIALTRRLLEAKRQIDHARANTENIRTQFALLPAGVTRTETICQFLRMTSELIDLSGRMRYRLRDVIDETAYFAAAKAEHRKELLDLLIEYESSIGAAIMSVLLIDPAPESGAKPATDETKEKVLKLIGVTGQVNLLPTTAEFVLGDAPPHLTIMATEVIRGTGLPQDPRDADGEKPAISAKQLHGRLVKLKESHLDPTLAGRRTELLDWLTVRMTLGVTGATFRYGRDDLREGDWFLMRNPSPYNLFTDLSPGLFTHVGVVAAEQGTDGKRRFVIVDLPERGKKIPAKNADVYLPETLNYLFVRHPDPEVGRAMARVALSIIGNETEFDLTFKTEKVYKLKGEPLKGKRINTYCAGFLVLCAQETKLALDEFFPIRESPAPGNTLDNLKKLGMSIGNSFVSPTGALLSPNLRIVARRDPMYDPTREIKEAIYDHFARCMQEKTLTPSPNAVQSLRQRVAEMSKGNPLLSRILAQANNVSEHMDLVSAAKAAAVIETLDSIGDENMDHFINAHQALRLRPSDTLTREGFSDDDIQLVQRYQQRHKELYLQLTDGRLTSPGLQQALVTHYVERGKQQLDERFFSAGQ